MIPNYVVSITFFLYLYLEARADANLLNAGSFIYEHKTRAMRRTLVILMLSVINVTDLTQWLINFFGFAFLFAGLFDNLLNYLRGYYLWYLGKTASWDKFWRKHKLAYKTFVILSIIVGIYLDNFI